MISASFRPPSRDNFDDFRRNSVQSIERAALRSVAVAAGRGKAAIRSQFSGAGLAGLGRAIDANSDADTGTIKRRGATGFSVSAAFFVRSESERTLGAIASYTDGADIVPVRGRWLWFATDEIPKRAGRKRMTPALYRANGFEGKIGPLIFVRSINGNPLLVVKGATVNEAGKPRTARSRLKKGGLPKGQRGKEFIVAFIGIPRTSRAARVNITAILNNVRAQLPEIFNREMDRKVK